jgi:hypothetical protein
MWENMKLSSDSGDSDIKKCKQSYAGVWQSPRLAGEWSLESGNQFVLVCLAGIWIQSL